MAIFFEVIMKKLEWHTDKGKTRGGFVCHILTVFSMMLLPMLNPLLKSLMLAPVSWCISFIMLALYASSNFFAFSEVINEGEYSLDNTR